MQAAGSTFTTAGWFNTRDFGPLPHADVVLSLLQAAGGIALPISSCAAACSNSVLPQIKTGVSILPVNNRSRRQRYLLGENSWTIPSFHSAMIDLLGTSSIIRYLGID